MDRKAEAEREYKLYLECRDAEKETDTQARACNEALGAKAAAIPEVCRAMLNANDPEKLVLLGQLLGDHAEFALALDPLKKVVEADSKSFDAWHNLGLSYFRLRQYAEARVPLEKAAALPVLERAHQLRPGDAQLGRVVEQLRSGK